MPLPPFANEPVLELRRAAVRANLAGALADHDARGPLRVPVWVGDDRREGDDIVSTDPGNPERVVATAAAATEDEVRAALAAARPWRAPAGERAETLLRAAQWLRERRLEVAALEVRECAKPWPEADADVCEAIDFLEYYARGAIDLAQGAPLLQPPGERNELRWSARGIVAVISPWNFPVAIPCGMVAAGLATGNAVVLKPAEQSPGCAYELVRALRESGVPPAALALLPGEGDVGAALVRDPRVHTIAFTGSGLVGLEIVRVAAEVPPVIEQAAQERVARYAGEAERAGRIAARVRAVPGDGWFAAPTLAADLPADSPVLNEEIFGPLLAIERVRDVDDACDRVDDSPFALTGGLFARNPDTVERVIERSPVGNLYVNRAITGAMVARQPFGGNRLSGTGTKAGGPGYLLQFVEPRVVTENTMRHGLVV